jgi:hypothetical protein
MLGVAIILAVLSKAWTIFAHSNTRDRGFETYSWQRYLYCVRLFYVCVVMCVGGGLARADSPSKDSYRLYIRSRNLKSGKGPTKGRRAIIIINSVAIVRKRTIPTERPPFIGEVGANFCGLKVSRGQRNGSSRPYSRFSRPEPLLFLPSSSSIVITRLSGFCSRSTTFQKIW